MNTTKKTYDVYGNCYVCYILNNGYDKVVSVFNAQGDLLFKFEEPINGSQLIFLLKGYSIAHNGVLK